MTATPDAATGLAPLDFRPAPGSARRSRMLGAQTRMELSLNLRHGESVLLTLIIPIGLLLFFSAVDVLPSDGQKSVDFLVPGVLAPASAGWPCCWCWARRRSPASGC